MTALTLALTCLITSALTSGVGVYAYLRGRRDGIRIGLAVEHSRRIDAAAQAARRVPLDQAGWLPAEPLGYDWTGLPVWDSARWDQIMAEGAAAARSFRFWQPALDVPGALESRPPTSPGDQPEGTGPGIHDNPDGGITK